MYKNSDENNELKLELWEWICQSSIISDVLDHYIQAVKQSITDVEDANLSTK